MADVSGITAVRPTSDTTTRKVAYGATVDEGNLLYLDTSDNEYKLAESDGTSAVANASAIAMTPGVDGGYGIVATDGTVVLVGATLSIGESYAVSTNAGEITNQAGIGSGNYVTNVGIGVTATNLKLNFDATGITHA